MLRGEACSLNTAGQGSLVGLVDHTPQGKRAALALRVFPDSSRRGTSYHDEGKLAVAN